MGLFDFDFSDIFDSGSVDTPSYDDSGTYGGTFESPSYSVDISPSYDLSGTFGGTYDNPDYAAVSSFEDSLDGLSLSPSGSYDQSGTYGGTYESPSYAIKPIDSSGTYVGTFNAPDYKSLNLSSLENPGLDDYLQKAGTFLSSPGGKLVTGLGGAAISALDAMRKNELQKKALKKYQQDLAARRVEAAKYGAPIRLNYERAKVASPKSSGGGEAVYFTNNKLPAYASGGHVDSPSALGFIKYMLAGKKFPSEVAEEEAARRRALIYGDSQTPEAGVLRLKNRKQMLDEIEQGTAPQEQDMRTGGLSRYVRGGTPGQADKIHAALSDGEYVMDSDVVSALGDGNNEAGAKALDEFRENIRAHKRSAPANKIPPKAKKPAQYLKGAKQHG